MEKTLPVRETETGNLMFTIVSALTRNVFVYAERSEQSP